MPIYYIDRKSKKKLEEKVAGDLFVKLINETKPGKFVLETIVKKKFFSSFYGKLQDTSFSASKVKKFVSEFNIDMSEALIEDITKYKNFNDFFTRKLKPSARKIDFNQNHLVSPADGKLLVYNNLDPEKTIQIKGKYYELSELLQNKSDADIFEGGSLVVVRLCPSDYHRFHFPDSGTPSKSFSIDGDYYSVNPLSLKEISDVYTQNKREITWFESDNFGLISMIDVGATCVGSIIQTYQPYTHVEKSCEKGYFKFGGSTVIMLFKRNTVKFDEDLVENSKHGLETKVLMGEKIGVAIK